MGIIILFIFIIYMSVGFFISKIVYKRTQRKLYSRLVIAFFLVFPFWDLILQEAIAVTYSSFNKRVEVYKKAELDKDGKIDSLAYLSYLGKPEYYTVKKLDKYYNKNFAFVRSHLEFLVKDPKDGEKKILKIKKISQGKYDFEYIKESQARYRVIWENSFDIYFMGLSFKKVIDSRNNEVLVKTYSLYFKQLNRYFRENILYMVGGNGIGIFGGSNISTATTSKILSDIGLED